MSVLKTIKSFENLSEDEQDSRHATLGDRRSIR
jgi:hypothetical protein